MSPQFKCKKRRSKVKASERSLTTLTWLSLALRIYLHIWLWREALHTAPTSQHLQPEPGQNREEMVWSPRRGNPSNPSRTHKTTMRRSQDADLEVLHQHLTHQPGVIVMYTAQHRPPSVSACCGLHVCRDLIISLWHLCPLVGETGSDLHRSWVICFVCWSATLPPRSDNVTMMLRDPRWSERLREKQVITCFFYCENPFLNLKCPQLVNHPSKDTFSRLCWWFVSTQTGSFISLDKLFHRCLATASRLSGENGFISVPGWGDIREEAVWQVWKWWANTAGGRSQNESSSFLLLFVRLRDSSQSWDVLKKNVFPLTSQQTNLTKQ